VRGDGDLQLIEEPLLWWRGVGHPPEPDLSTVGRREDNVGALERREERQGLRRRQAGAAVAQQMFQRHPERVAEKRDQQMRLHPPLELMEHRTNRQVTFQRTKGRLGLGQLDGLGPEFLDGLALEMGAQQLSAVPRVAPGAPVLDQRPVELQLAVLVAEGHLV
jgi:hypothetical protein